MIGVLYVLIGIAIVWLGFIMVRTLLAKADESWMLKMHRLFDRILVHLTAKERGQSFGEKSSDFRRIL